MHLTLINFGHYAKKHVILQPNSFILLKGDNGSGKSTVFEAICWVLYDKYKKVRKGTEKCEVILKTKDFTVKRTSKPKTLHLTYGESVLEGSSAQHVLSDKLLGMNWQQFCLSSMIHTNAKCSLVSITPKERFDVIRELVSSLDEPKKHLEKIKQLEEMYKSTKSVCFGEANILEKQLSQFSTIPEATEWDPSKYQELRDCLKEKQAKKDKWLQILSTGMPKDKAEERLAQLDNTDNLKSKLAGLKECLIYLRHENQTKSKREEYEKTKREYFLSLEKEKVKLSDELQNIDIDQLKQIATECFTRKDNQDDNPYWDWSPEDIKNEIVRLQVLTTRQPCPLCQGQIAIKDSKIIKWDSKWSETGHDNLHFLRALQHLKHPWDPQSMEKWDIVSKKKNRLNEVVRCLKDQTLPPYLNAMKKSFGEKLSIPKSFKSRYTEEYLEQRIEELTGELGSYPKEHERKMLETIVQCKSFPTQHKIDKITSEIGELEDQLEKLKIQEDEHTKYIRYRELEDQLKETRQKEKEANDFSVAISTLKKIREEAETLSMESTVNTLNILAEEYLVKFFDETIKVQIVNLKKTQKAVSIGLSLEIEYKGQSYTIDEFSQGEAIKINLAFILAMNQMLRSPYLFLDEVLQNLDKRILLDIYACLKTITSAVSVYIIDHNCIEGFFDDVIAFP
jgi:DNA repair exonuclease SbcCD ATPase subunit